MARHIGQPRWRVYDSLLVWCFISKLGNICEGSSNMIDICMALDQSVSPQTGVRTIQNTGVFWLAVFQPPRPCSLFLEHGSAAKTLISHPHNTASYAGYWFICFCIGRSSHVLLTSTGVAHVELYRTLSESPSWLGLLLPHPLKWYWSYALFPKG